jgi:hypothetical protein
MKLCVKALAIAGGVLGGGSMLLVGLATTVNGVALDGGYYAKDFLLAMASIYPGFRGQPGWSDALLGGAYGLLDGAIAGAVLAVVYNLFARDAD